MPPSTPPAAPVFTRAEQASLGALRARYRAGRDLFDAQIDWLLATAPSSWS